MADSIFRNYLNLKVNVCLGEMKQLAWIGKLRGLLESTENIDMDVRGIVDTILNHENVPRKRPKENRQICEHNTVGLIKLWNRTQRLFNFKYASMYCTYYIAPFYLIH